MYKVDEAKCTGCGTCIDVCPNEAIALVGDKAKINPDDCLECGSCEGECPSEAISEA
jgi:NAD-dependent dihydropyrimidine dehydrogenase PreA subunit